MGKHKEKQFNHRVNHPRLFSIYYNMLDRCNNPRNRKYNIYGGRGIKVCEEWLGSRNAFIVWALDNGYSKELQLDRSNNDGGYYPLNCRWVTPKENSRNTSHNKLITYNGEIRPLVEWCERFNISYTKTHNRIKRGWSAEQAFSPINNIQRKCHRAETIYMDQLREQIDKRLTFFQVDMGGATAF